MPSSRHHSFGDIARPWQDILVRFDKVAEENESLRPMAALVGDIANSEYAKGGLHATTSIHDLLISQSKDIYGNPNLRIHWDVMNGRFEFTYEDGSLEPWVRTCKKHEVFDVFERFLTKRARWFRSSSLNHEEG